MKQLVCEMCGSTDLVKDGGVFVCQSCGCKYSVEEARKMMVEGTVEVTGSVSIDNSFNIDTWLDLARKAVEAENGKQANDYADKVLQADSCCAEAWFIKGQGADLESTVGIDRRDEAMTYFEECRKIIHGRLTAMTGDDIKLLRSLQKAINEMVRKRALAFMNGYEESQSDSSLKRALSINGIAKEAVTVNALIAQPLSNHKDECIKALEESGEATYSAKSIYDSIMGHEVETGQRCSLIATALAGVGAKVAVNMIKAWNGGGHIFDYYGTGPHNDSTEKAKWAAYVDGLDDATRVVLSAIDLYQIPAVLAYEGSEDKVGEQVASWYGSVITIQEMARDARSNRRYHNRYANERKVTNDGFYLIDSEKARRNNLIAGWQAARDAADPVKRRAAERKKIEEAEQGKRNRAQRLLEGRYYVEHPDEKRAYDAASSALSEASKERAECTESIKKLSVFKRKELKKLEARVAELRATEQRCKAEMEQVEARRSDWIAKQLPSLLDMDESEWTSLW